MGKSRILVVGATGNLGHHLVNASLAYDHPTFALVRDSAFSDPHKSHLINSLIESGVHLIKGSLQDQATLIEAIKQVDVVICAVSSNQVLDQKLLIQAIKEVGCIKRFIPSEFGVDPDKVQISDLAQNFYSNKVEIRRIIEKEGIPYTFISCNLFAGYLLPSLVQPGLKNPPRDKIRIFGDGNTKAVFVKVCDVASFTISTVEDPRTLNKVLYLRPPGNVYSMNELVEIWEMKIGKKLEKVYIPEEEVLKIIQETPYPSNRDMIFIYSAFIKGDHTHFDIETSGTNGTELYPHVKYTTIKNENHNGTNLFSNNSYLGASISTTVMANQESLSMEGKSKVLIIGATGYLGKFIVTASARAGHSTFALIRESTASNPEKAKTIENLKTFGVTLLYGDLYDHESLVKAIKQVDVVISTLGHHDLEFKEMANQTKIIAAIKEVGTVKRFFPAEFGMDVDRVHAVDPVKSAFEVKATIRRAIEAERIPYTFVSANLFMSFFPPRLGQADATAPPTDKIVILGDGNVKAVFVDEEDMATYTIKAIDDPRTLNKILYLRPPANIYSINELVSLWEKKTCKTIERIYVPEEQVLKNIQEAPAPMNVFLSIAHTCFVKGDQTNFEIEPSIGVEASELYPEVKYTTVDEFLNQFI
ncbi:Isoflavone reductase-like protein IRL [Cinnamomum micranthum f. kanehirae]|uniref:Isoflavone reductase-like protein IRL n=1 Tax=Cinnamomum micranthum f. kanehirae TaxID=337451 RepID=A0A443NV49_9MAGN|nr:Isoflavone reductase-like protein IRL [Cinnamomum micranthum f. kanehirae]